MDKTLYTGAVNEQPVKQVSGVSGDLTLGIRTDSIRAGCVPLLSRLRAVSSQTSSESLHSSTPCFLQLLFPMHRHYRRAQNYYFFFGFLGGGSNLIRGWSGIIADPIMFQGPTHQQRFTRDLKTKTAFSSCTEIQNSCFSIYFTAAMRHLGSTSQNSLFGIRGPAIQSC